MHATWCRNYDSNFTYGTKSGGRSNAPRGGGWKLANATCILLGIGLLLTTAACSRSRHEASGHEISYERNSQFGHPWARVYLTLDGIPLSVNTADDAVETGPGETIIPGYQARDWVFVKEEDSGTSVVHAVFNWDSDNPADYLMLGTWAWFPDQKHSDLSLFEGPQRTGAIVDGPEIDPRYPPDMPLSGTATYSGRASGTYRYDQSEERRVHDEYEGTVTLTADFGDGTVEGCIGCVGDILTRVSRLDILRGRDVDEQPADLTDYEIHLNATPYNPDGTFGPGDATVEHPTRDITTTQGVWVGVFSNVPDDDGNPRLAGGLNLVTFEDENGEGGRLHGSFVGVSETYRDSRK